MNYETKYKILTWNILWNKDYFRRLDDVVKLISNEHADIVLVQEISEEFTNETITAFAKQGYKLHVKCHKKGELSRVGVAYNPTVFRECEHGPAIDVDFQAISLDLIPVDRKFISNPPTFINPDNNGTESPLDFGNEIITVISYHGTWGTFAQANRLSEVTAIDSFAKQKGNAVILGGDFNALPNEPSVRFLMGGYLVNGTGTYWGEAQELIKDMGGQAPYPTSFTHGLVAETASRFNIRRTPERRIDYLFDFGYSYGRQYAIDGWTHFSDIDAARNLSDHAPLVAGLLQKIDTAE